MGIKRKRIVSGLLSLVMLISLMATMALTASADGTGMYFRIENEEAILTSYEGMDRAVTIPSTVDGYPVTTIGNSAFSIGNKLESVTFPSTLTHIGVSAFHGCNALKSVTIPNSVISIGNSAFYGCTALTSVKLPNGLTAIGDAVFSDCVGLTGITIPDTVTSIGSYAFRGCTGLTGITIPDGVTGIGSYAFCGCTGLTDITIPDRVTCIEEGTFMECSGLTGITIPNHVTEIGDYAFFGCISLTGAVTIPDSVTGIGIAVFDACDKITAIEVAEQNPNYVSLDGVLFNKDKTAILRYPEGKSGQTKYVIPDSVTAIGERTFYACDGLTSITIPSGVTKIGKSAFCSCHGLTSVTIPTGVTYIEDMVFYACIELTDITIPNTVIGIGRDAFYGCKFAGIVLPDGVKTIGEEAFLCCYSLMSITIPNSVTDIGWRAFESCPSIKEVIFQGTQNQWNKINIGDENESLLNAKRTYQSSSNPTPVKPTPTPSKPTIDVTKQFSDVKAGAWYTKAVSYAVNDGLFKGMTDTTFAPEAQMTRSMFVAVLGRLAGVSVNKNTATKFKDVPTGTWYTGYVAWAAKEGIVGGTSATTFAPDANVTREQICKMMAEYCNYAGITLQNKNKAMTFKDADQISGWAKKYVSTCQKAGLVNGSDGKFNPKANASRAEVAQILMNFSNNYLK